MAKTSFYSSSGATSTETDAIEGSVNAAAASQVAAATSETNAANSATAAASSAAASSTSSSSSTVAKTASETAKTASETAKTASETARDLANVYKDAAAASSATSTTKANESAASATAASNSSSAGSASASAASASQLSAASSATAAANSAASLVILDEDNMASNSASSAASQQSIKAYVDTQITAEDLDITTDSGTIAIDLDSETLTVSGGTGLDSSATGNAVTLAIDSTVATLTGSQTLTNKSLTAPTLTGTATVASLDISGDIDVDGTTNLDAVDIDGAVSLGAALTAADGAEVRLGVDNDMALFHSSGTNHIRVNSGIFKLRADDMRFTAQDQTERMHLTSAGLGIGGTPATNTKLLVKAGTNLNFEVENASSNLRMSALNDARDANIGLQIASSGVTLLTGGMTSPSATITQTGSVSTVPLSVHSNLNSGQQILELRSTGNSNSTLDLRADGTGDPRVHFDLNGSTPFAIGVDNSDGDKFKISGNSVLGTNDRFVIDSTGNVGIACSPADKLHVAGDVRFNGQLKMFDNQLIKMGDSDDLTIYHDTSAGNLIKSNNSFNLTLDVAGDINLDAAGNQINFKNDGTTRVTFELDATPEVSFSGGNLAFNNLTQDADIAFKGFDSSSFITALTLDMSEAGAAIFNSSATFGGAGTFTTTDNSDTLTLTSTDADSNIGPVLKLHRNSGSPADGDQTGYIYFTNENSASEAINYAQIHSSSEDVTDGTEDGGMELQTMVDGTMRSRIGIQPTQVVINDSSVDSDFRIESNGNTHALFVDGGNNVVSIGTASPADYNDYANNLVVYEAGSHGGITIATNGDYHTSLYFADGTSGDERYRGYLDYDHADDTLDIGVAGTHRLTVKSTGLGIGTSAPSSLLDIRGSGNVDVMSKIINTSQSSNGRKTEFLFGKDNGANLSAALRYVYDATQANRKIELMHYGTTNGLTIADNGDVGIGTAAAPNGSAAGFWFSSDQFYTSTAGTGANYQVRMYNGNGLVGSIVTDGSATAFNTSSDYRLKENVSYTWDATTRLKKLKPARFNFIADDTNTLVDGFLAHEVSSVVPEAITGEKDGEEMQSIDQSKIVPLLVKALQEQQTTIEALTARITTLEG